GLRRGRPRRRLRRSRDRRGAQARHPGPAARAVALVAAPRAGEPHGVPPLQAVDRHRPERLPALRPPPGSDQRRLVTRGLALRLLAASALAAGIVAAAGCGGGDETTSTVTAPSTIAPTTSSSTTQS